jgi:ferredoxin-thioredoxin reductase catalytic subunit
MNKKNFHSVPWDGDWAVKKEGVNKPISVHRTQATAEDKTRILAKKAEVEAVYHNRQGIIKDKDSYGNDDCPPRDKKF